MVLDGFEKIVSAISMRDESGTKIQDLVIGCGEIILPDLHISHGEVSKGPAAIGRIGQSLIERHARDLSGAEYGSGCGIGGVY